MKKYLCIIAAIAFTLTFSNKQTQAQQALGEVVLQGGIGNSFGQSILKKGINIALDTFNVKRVRLSPVYYLGADVGLTPWFSVGASYTHNRFTWEDKWRVSLEDALDKIPGNIELPWIEIEAESTVRLWLVRDNIGLQALFHTPKNRAFSGYCGLRGGLSFWRAGFRATSPVGSLYETYQIPITITTVTTVWGVQGYFNEYIGMHGEFAIGTGPYFARIGLQLRIPNKNSYATESPRGTY